jgi:hypothetical protein
MFGSIRKLPSGKFQARYTLAQGTQTTAGVYPTRKDAETALLQLEAEASRGQLWDGRKGRTLFRDYMTHYMAFRANGGKVRPHTGSPPVVLTPEVWGSAPRWKDVDHAESFAEGVQG